MEILSKKEVKGLSRRSIRGQCFAFYVDEEDLWLDKEDLWSRLPQGVVVLEHRCGFRVRSD